MIANRFAIKIQGQVFLFVYIYISLEQITEVEICHTVKEKKKSYWVIPRTE